MQARRLRAPAAANVASVAAAARDTSMGAASTEAASRELARVADEPTFRFGRFKVDVEGTDETEGGRIRRVWRIRGSMQR